MKRIKSKIVVVMALCLAFLSSISVISFNADAKTSSSSLTVSPPHQMIALIPGETYDGNLKVSNSSNSDRDSKFSVLVGSYSQREDEENDGKKVDVVDENERSNYNQIMDWIKLGVEEGTVAPGETMTVPYSIEVPNDAPAGGQYATIIIRDATDGGDEGGNVSIQNMVQFASIIYAKVAGETRDTGEILENNIPSFLLSNPLEATASVKNTGNVHTEAEYTLQVWPLFSDEEICTNEEKAEKSLVLPEQEQFHTQTCELPAVGIFHAKQTVKVFDEISVVEGTIIMCPLWLLFLILFVIVAIIIWIVMKIRSGSSKKAKRQETQQQ